MTQREDPQPPSGRFWPLFIVGILGVNVLAVGVLIWLSSSDRSFFVEPDYYRKALSWDAHKVQQQANQRLGWRNEVSLQWVGEQGLRIEAKLVDRDGAPLQGGTVIVRAFHKARARRVHTATLAPQGPGIYAAVVRAYRPGLWEFRFEITRGNDRVAQRVEREL